MTNGEIIENAASEGTSESPCSQFEGYPAGWWHCTIHLNPETGEMHSDGDHRVRTWIQNRLQDAQRTACRDCGQPGPFKGGLCAGCLDAMDAEAGIANTVSHRPSEPEASEGSVG